MKGQDQKYMKLALELARKGQGATHPNPMVGAVVVRSGRMVGRGFHKKAGAPHAEIQALRQAGLLSRGATLYVTLEPCAHFGRTPPCVKAIVTCGIRRVVAAMIDPDPRNRGRGIKQLRSLGIPTTVGVLEKEARELSRPFITRVTRNRPFVTVKMAISLDGKIATTTGESRWISGPQARVWAQRLRAQVDAILVGVETLLKDNPRLTVRTAMRKQPLKVILDSHLRTPASARIFASRTPVLIATGKKRSPRRERRLRAVGAEIVHCPSQQGRVDLKFLLRELARYQVTHLLIEGGGETVASAFAAKVVDQAAFIVAPLLIGGREAPTAFEGGGISSLKQAIALKNVRMQPIGRDFLVTADV